MNKSLHITLALSFFCAAAMLVSCTRKPVAGPALLSGDIQGDFDALTVISYPPGVMGEYIDPEVSDGHFELSLDASEGFIDLAVAVDDDVFGARVNAGETMKLLISAKGDGHFDIKYDGSTEAESRIWTDWYDAYGYMGKYNIKPDADPGITPGESLKLLDENDAAFRSKYGSRLSDYHVHRADLAHDFLAAVLMETGSGYDYSELYSDSRYLDIIGKVNPEDPYVAGSGLLARWASYQMRDMGDDPISARLAFMKSFKGKICNDASRAMLAAFCAIPLQTAPQNFDDALCAEFVDALRSFDEGGTELADKCAAVYEAFKATRPGSPMPDVNLTAPDGSKTPLSSLFGKVLYIDFWATWCGPCVKETPAMAALAQRMKDSDDILCISVSTDNTDAPWLAKIEADKPGWPQYRLDVKDDKSFSSALNINTIPRFIIVGKDGRIYDADAIRPSDPDIDSVLLKAASE